MRFNTTDDSEKKIPRDFYKLFRTQNMEYYMRLLTALYEADQEAYALTRLTDSECREHSGGNDRQGQPGLVGG